MFVDNQFHILLILLATAWCVFHSALIAIPVTEFFRSFMGGAFRFYRLIYNLFSILTLLPVVYIEYGFRDNLLFAWEHPVLQVIRIFLFVLCMLLFIFGSRQYDGMEFLGLRQIKTGNTNRTLSVAGVFNTKGIQNFVRHPWYLGVMILIWLRNIYDTVLLVNLVFTVYLIIGSLLEEMKLKKEFGNAYLQYQKRVSMLLPWKWLLRRLRRK